MPERLSNLRELLRGSLWFLPGLIALLALALGVGLLRLDMQLGELRTWWWLFSGSTDQASALLSAIATAVATVAGVAFSVTVVALTMAASQFGSLLLASYLRDSVSQTVLGIFIGTFLYCLLILSNLDEGGTGNVPMLALNFSLLLGMASLFAFIAFIHDLTQSLRSERLAARVGGELIRAVDAFFPKERLQSMDAPPADSTREGFHVLATGYLQTVEVHGLIRLAAKNDLVITLTVRPGDFLTAGSQVGYVQGGRTSERLKAKLARYLLIGHQRTPTQDPEYAVHQLAQVAVRALSPAINDPFTALTCIDWLESALRRAASRQNPSGIHCDRRGQVRVITADAGFELMADAAFNKLSYAARGNAAVLERLIQIVAGVAEVTHRGSDLESLTDHLQRLNEEVDFGLHPAGVHAEARALITHAAQCVESRRREIATKAMH